MFASSPPDDNGDSKRAQAPRTGDPERQVQNLEALRVLSQLRGKAFNVPGK